MRRRFGRGRRNAGADNGGETPLDARLWMERIGESGLAGSESLTPLELAGVPAVAAVLGEGEGGDPLVAWSPVDAGTALFAGLALVGSRTEFTGRLLAIAPDWSPAARRRLARVRPGRFRLEALAAPQLLAGAGVVSPAPPAEPLPIAPERVARGIASGPQRELFERALLGLRGLAAKHGGVLCGREDRLDLLLLARPVASLRTTASGVRLELGGAERTSLELTAEGLATALDRLEGSLRKLLNDRHIRASESGLRAALVPQLQGEAGDLQTVSVWPLAAGDAGPVDWVGVDRERRLVVGASRERLDLPALGEVVDAVLDPRLPWLLRSGDGVPPRAGSDPGLLLAAQEYDAAALQVVLALSLDTRLYDATGRRGGPLRLTRRKLERPGAAAPAERVERAAAAPAERAISAPVEQAAAAPVAAAPAERAVSAPVEQAAAAPVAAAPATQSGVSLAGPGETTREESPRREARPSYDEVSLFDLEDEESGGDAGASPPRRRRSRGGRRRGRRGQGSGGPGREGRSQRLADEDGEPRTGAAPAAEVGERRSGGRPQSRRAAPAELDEDELVDEEDLTTLAEDALEAEEPVDLAYEDEDAGDDDDGETDRLRRERELRRRARLAKTQPQPDAPPRPPRRRAAFVAHADRVSVLTAVLLARDVRLVESFWVYPQEDLMTFFRSVATDLREETPIFLVGFNASPPARDTLQAASLYRGRLQWFDHHAWPPEDRLALGEAIGEDAVHIEEGAESSLASVIGERTRRSRFSDKLVELVTGRFTQHDYERWGRLWWHRAGEIAERRGDRRGDIEPLLAGRPSDLAKESARLTAPPAPPEVDFVSQRDFRLVHFGGFVMVVLEVPEALDLHLASRIARERYDAQLSLAAREEGDLLVLAGDESRARRGLDLGSMASHLAAKHEWITALADDDHVARVRVRDLRTVPGRLDEVIGEIAMGRSIVEG